MTSTRWGTFPLFKEPPSWRIRLGSQAIRIDEDVITLIRKDPLHIWGWYDAEIAQAWSEIAPAVLPEDCPDLPHLTDMVWLQEISPFWNFLTDIPQDRRDSLSTTDTLSAIARAAICPISGGGLLCNTSRIRRKESLAVSPNPLQLGRQSDITQISSDSEVYPSVRVRDPLLRVEGEGIPRVSIHLEDDPKQLMGNVAEEGMEFVGSGGSALPNQ